MRIADEMGRAEKLDSSIQKTVNSIARQATGLAKQVELRGKLTSTHRAEVVEVASSISNLPEGQSLQEDSPNVDPKDLVAANISALQELSPGLMITFKVKTKSGTSARFGAYSSHSEEILRVLTARGKEVTWRMDVVSAIKSTISKAGSSSSSEVSRQAASHVGSEVEAIQESRDEAPRREAPSASGGIMASLAKRRKLDLIASIGKMTSDDLDMFAQGRSVIIEGVNWSYSDAVDDNDVFQTYITNDRHDEIFNAWYDRANELLNGEFSPPWRPGLESSFLLFCVDVFN